MGAPRHKLDSRFAELQKKYNAIAPKLMKLVPKGAGPGLQALAGLGDSSKAYMEIDFDALRNGGYNDLARAMEKSAEYSLEAGEKGLEALEVKTVDILVLSNSLSNSVFLETESLFCIHK